MGKVKEPITILALGDRIDHDTYRKFYNERPFILQSGFDYISTSYKRFLTKDIPPIKTKKVIIFLFFPFVYWNKYIETKHYKGIYSNRIFYKKFLSFWSKVDSTFRDFLSDKEVFFVNSPSLCGLYRDKSVVAKKFLKTHIPTPKIYNISKVKEIRNLINKGNSFFLKPRYGSMGKGITFLSWSNWQTNFIFKKDKIISRKSDYGWRFRDITGNTGFLRKLLRKDILIEKAVDSLVLKKMKIDMRIYVFFNKVIYVYPRKNRVERITTNISQGAKGDPSILKDLPRHLINKAKKLAQAASKVLRLNLVGMDIMIDRNLKDVYILDANIFPGFPKRRTFNLTQSMIEELIRLESSGELRFEKGRSF